MFSERGPFAAFKWEALFQDRAIFLKGFQYTLLIALCALLLALLLGVIFGVMSTSSSRVFRGISRVYVEFFQNTPLLILIFFMFNGLPMLGLVWNVTTIGILGVGIYHGAYITEVVRAGIQSIKQGQFEAAASQGFNYQQTMFYIILPQAVKVMLPPLTNQAVNLIKNTSMVAIISGVDIMYAANSWSGNNLYYGPAYVVAGLLYFIICFPLAKLSTRLERWVKYGSQKKQPEVPVSKIPGSNPL